MGVEFLSAVLQSFRMFLRFSTSSVVPQRLVRDTILLEKYRQFFSCDFARTVQVLSTVFLSFFLGRSDSGKVGFFAVFIFSFHASFP